MRSGLLGAALALLMTPALLSHGLAEEAQTVPTGREGKCGAVDLVIAIDTTHSMGRAIREMKRESVRLLDLVAFVSGGDYRLGLIAFRDEVVVEQDLGVTADAEESRRLISWAIRRLKAEGGQGGPEASDEALRTAVLSLGSEGRRQTGDFNGIWEARSRILVVITDNLPGGFDDKFEEGRDDRQALSVATDALQRNIRISSVYVPTSSFLFEPDPRVAEIMRAYPQLTGGVFAITGETGQGAAEAIAKIIDRCGASPLS